MRVEGKQDTGIEPENVTFFYEPVIMRKMLVSRLVAGFSCVNI